MTKHKKKFKNIKRIAMTTLALATMFTFAQPSMAQIKVNIPPVIHQRQKAKPIASGISHEHIEKFTTLGWWNINVLRVDLENPFVDIKPIFHQEGLSKRDRPSSMVLTSNAVAGINGEYGFFEPVAGSLGPIISNGKIITARSEAADPLPSIFIDFLNNAHIDYMTRKTTATNLNTGVVINPSPINSLIPDFSHIVFLTKEWGEKSIGTKYHPDLVEVLVVDDVVVDVRQGKEAIVIPENGYIFASRGMNAAKLLTFSPGDKIEIKMDSNIDIKNTKFSIGGFSNILKDGNLIKPDLNLPGSQPRTGMGISKDGKELILVTIDGRHNSYKGVSQEIFGHIMRDLGAYNAINLDGGGSTLMAIKPLGQDKVQVMNTPSDGPERYVPNGVGLFSSAPVEELAYLEVSTSDNRMFVNTSRKIDVKGFDKNHNPVEIDPSLLSYHYEITKGAMAENVFTALAPETTKVMVKYGEILGEIDLTVLGPPIDITTDTSNIYVAENSEIKLPTFYGVDANGVKASIGPEHLAYSLTKNIGKIENGVFYSGDKTDAAIITAKLGQGSENINVYVGNGESLIDNLDSLENVKFSSYPNLVTGSLALDEDSKIGSSSIQLKYDFSQGDMTRAAYIDFLDNAGEGLSLKGTPTKLALWVKGDNSGSWLRGSVIDSKGKEHAIDFSKSIDWTGWEYKTATIPGNISYPVKLKRVYLAETDPAKKTINQISIDGLTGYYPPTLGIVQVPVTSKFKDPLNKKAEVLDNGFSFNVTMEPKISDKTGKNKVLNDIKNLADKNNMSIFLNGISTDFQDILKGQYLFDASGSYDAREFKNSLFISLKTSSKGIRENDFKQWNHMFYNLNTSKSQNIFLLLDSPVWGNSGFADKLEADLFHEYMMKEKDKDKNVFVIHGGGSNSSLLKDGIRYIGLDTKEIKDMKDINKLYSIDFVVNGKDISYQINPSF